MRRRRYEVTEMYALIDISNQMLEDSCAPQLFDAVANQSIANLAGTAMA